MAQFDITLIEDYRSIAADGDENSIDRLRSTFLEDLPEGYDGEALFSEAAEQFEAEEFGAVCAELILTLTASCERDDFHNWDYDHLSFIIELSNNYGFHLPQNLLNGLPEQLIILVDSDKVEKPGCD
ncbi:MAG TPA: hypothetical protein VJ967_07160 [Clostridia bacterium]|nr:hypothetical protein [Clostridia bacterium]